MAKPIRRTDRLNVIKPIVGTNKGVLYDQNGKGPRQLACPSCQSANISPSRDGSGHVIYKCTCGATFRLGGRLT